MKNNQSTSFLGELIQRRVPQIVGLYIAATWMMIEIGDWMVGRFNLPPHITSYIFIGMIIFVPSVFYLAYQYGKPGHDPWKKPTFVIVPLNLALSFGAMLYVVTPVQATETKTLVDEQGKVQTFEVPKKEFNKTLLNFFWKNETGDESLDWLQYGLPWLLGEDLDRSMFISSHSPLNSSSITRQIRNAGFKAAIKVPRSLKQQIAQRRFYQFITSGKFEKVGEEFKLSVELIDVMGNMVIADHQVQGEDYLMLIDELTVAIKDSLSIPKTLDEQATDMAVVDHVSESKKAIQLVVEAKTMQVLEGKYAESAKLLKQAIKEDFTFATAYGYLARMQQLAGATQEAQESLDAALKHEYKFTIQEKFKHKASTYGMRGDYESQVKVYDMWIELYPDDIKAHRAMAEILTITGLDYQKALKSMEKIRELDPMDDALLRDLSKLHLLNGEMEKAAHSLEQFLQSNPQNTGALVELADLYERQGMFEEAMQSLDKALLLDRGNLNAQLKNVHILLKQFKFSEAEDKINSLLSENQEPQSRFTILGTKMKLQMVRGEVTNAIQTSLEMEQSASHLPPILVIFQVKFQRALITASIGKFDEAYNQIESLRTLLQRPLSDILDVGDLSIAIAEKNVEKAEQLVAKLQKYFKDYPNPIFESALDGSLAQLSLLKKDYPKAVEYYRKSFDYMKSSVVNMQSSEELISMQAQLAEALRLSGKKEEAAKLIDEALIKFPSLQTALLQHAELNLDAGDFDAVAEAINKIEKVWENADQSLLELEKLKSLKARFEAKRSVSQSAN